jgi:hypothetical protein
LLSMTGLVECSNVNQRAGVAMPRLISEVHTCKQED